MARKLTFDGVSVPPRLAEERRVQLVFEGVEQAGPSYEVRVFLGNPSADENTPMSRPEGYVGSFHVYGYGVWPGKEDPKPRTRPGTARAPIKKSVPLPGDALDLLAADALSVTVVAVPYGAEGAAEAFPDLTISNVQLVPGPH